MSTQSDRIPFSVEISRMIEVLAAQIYPSPFALLRENTQNSFDAILLRKHLGHEFEPVIDLTIAPSEIRVADNGIGMSRDDLRNHFWRAGSSSKNNPRARAAGVVGTFGIGAMANFGIAEELIVVTESAITGERTRCAAKRSTLSVTEDCIDFQSEQRTGSPGTIVTALMQPDKVVNVDQAKNYITEFVAFLPIPVLVNGQLVSQKPFDSAVPTLPTSWSFQGKDVQIGATLTASIDLAASANGELRIDLGEIVFRGDKFAGRLVLRQGVANLKTFRSRFGLAPISVHSAYQFGGVADFLFLEPTAGREAITTGSIQILQEMMSQIDDFVSLRLSERPESNSNTSFMTWVTHRNRYDLCGHLEARVEPGTPVTLTELKRRSEMQPLLVYQGADPASIAHASEDRPLVVVARTNPRRQCEIEYLRRFCRIEELSDEPQISNWKPNRTWSLGESALAFRVASILSADYFLDATISFGEISHSLPILVTKRTPPVDICLDPNGTTVRLILDVYEKDYVAFGSITKDFVRNVIFPRISDLVPSSTRQGAEAFLKNIQRHREVFEYEIADLDSLSAIWKDYVEGKLSMEEAAHRSTVIAVQSFQVIDSAVSAPVRDIVPDVIDNEVALQQDAAEVETRSNEAKPPIGRLDIGTDKKLLTIGESEQALRGYRCFLAISDRVREDKGHFFIQPHRTSVVWGGQKALFIFEHHSGEFGFYYDIQTSDLIGAESGGGSFETCTIVMKDRIFIPIPDAIRPSFLPKTGEKKRLEVRGDILHIEK